MSMRSVVRTIVALLFVPCVLASALAQMPNPYGLSISLENAKKAITPALAEATKNNWAMAVAIVDPAGNLVYYEKMDNTSSEAPTSPLIRPAPPHCSSAPQQHSRMRWPQVATACAFSAYKEQPRSRAVSRSSATAKLWERSASPVAPARRTANAPKPVPMLSNSHRHVGSSSFVNLRALCG